MVKTNFRYQGYISKASNRNASVFFYYHAYIISKRIILISVIFLSSLVDISLYTYNQSIFAFKSSNQLVSLNVTSTHPSNENATPFSLSPQQQRSSETSIEIVKIAFEASLSGDKAYQPNHIIIKPGMAIHWQNDDNILHTVTSGYGVGDAEKGKEFDSPLIQPDQMFFYKFSKSGVFPYFCVLHPIMAGEVIVKDELYGVTPQQPEQEEDREKNNGK